MTAIPHQGSGTTPIEESSAVHADLRFVPRYIFSTDHKVIGLQYLFTGLLFMLLGGLLAMLMRWNLAWPRDASHPVPILGHWMGWTNGIMPPDFYSVLMTMHGTVMIFFVIIVILVGAFGNYLIPLKIGAADMAFPFMNGLAFWSALPAGAIMLTGFFLSGNAAATGWTAYPPLSAIQFNGGGGASHFLPNLLRPAGSNWPMLPIFLQLVTQSAMLGYICWHYIRIGHVNAGRVLGVLLSLAGGILLTRSVQYIAFDGQSAWFFSLFWLGWSSLLGAINYITTIVKLRCPGMEMFRLPLSVWSLLITSLMVLLATPVLGSVLLVNLLDHHRITSFFEPDHWTLSSQLQLSSGGGYALLHQHLFWFYSHPAVYIMILPAMGMVSEIIATFARKPVFGYRPMVYAMSAIAFLGFIVWAHHMFQSGMNPMLASTFAISTMLIAVPSAIKTFNWLGTLWRGNIRFTVPMCNALAFVSMFVIGGLSGIFMASTAVDVQVHDTYFIVAHIHYVLFGGSLFGIFAAIYYYYPKMFGRMMNNKLGYLHFFASFIFFNGTFFAMYILGIRGFPRRVADYTNYLSFSDLQPMNIFISFCAFGLGLAQIPFIINFIGSWLWGEKASSNPWEATTLEWQTASPPPHGNFEKPPVVYRGPYEYASPLVEADYLPQNKIV